MDTTTRAYPVVGGWQAEDERLFIACFGRDEGEARAALDRARDRAAALAAIALERRVAGTLYDVRTDSEAGEK
jgi:hypothetical protein